MSLKVKKLDHYKLFKICAIIKVTEKVFINGGAVMEFAVLQLISGFGKLLELATKGLIWLLSPEKRKPKEPTH